MSFLLQFAQDVHCLFVLLFGGFEKQLHSLLRVFGNAPTVEIANAEHRLRQRQFLIDGEAILLYGFLRVRGNAVAFVVTLAEIGLSPENNWSNFPFPILEQGSSQ